jgi:glycosyltransferase involved in cell wall biosynthesis
VRILFIHQNMPAQFKHVAPALAADGHQVRFLTQTVRAELPGVSSDVYAAPPKSPPGHPYFGLLEPAVRTGQQVARALQALARRGFAPDLVIAHSGWGEPLFVKDVAPSAKLIVYAEYYYRPRGADIGFDPEEPFTLDMVCRTRLKNAHLLAALEACDAAVTPTRWQRDAHPRAYWPKLRQIHEGLDLARLVRRPQATLALPNGTVLRPGMPVVTYVARNLEPYRGLRTMVRAVPAILAARPDAHIVLVGGRGTSYGRKPPPPHGDWLSALTADAPLDPARVHCVGYLDYERYLDLLSLSAAHVYLTYPFVLSWSMLEAMAMGAPLIASDTAPVREVIQHGWNGVLTDFFDAEALARSVVAMLADGGASLAARARATVARDYPRDRSLAEWRSLVAAVAGGTDAPKVAPRRRRAVG